MQILDLEASLMPLRMERASLEEDLAAYTFPILDLPPEITAEILVHFFPTYPECLLLNGLESPELLTRICSQWRNIARSTPRLWRAMQVTYKESHVGIGGRHSALPDGVLALQTIQNWLVRSKTYPLSITFVMDLDAGLFPTPTHFIEAIVAYSSRWEYIELLLPHKTIVTLAAISSHFPLLHRLTVGPSTASPIYEMGPPLHLFQDAPRMKTATLSRLFDPSRMNLPWSQLTTLFALAFHHDECTQVLQSATSLVKFTCLLFEFDGGTIGGSVPPLMHLKSLILGLDSYDGRPGCVLAQNRVLDALIAPALTHLQISEHFFLYDPLPSITAFLSRLQCPLVSLHVTEARKSVDEYRSIFPSIDITVDAETS